MAPGLGPALTPGASAATQALVYHELALLLRAGVTLDQALAQAAGSGPWHLRKVLERLAIEVGYGRPLSDCMEAYKTLFHPVVPALVRAGEQSGTLDRQFELLAEFFEAEAQLKRTITGALVYPMIVVVVAILTVGILAFVGFMPATWAWRLIYLLGAVVALWLIMRFRIAQQAAGYVAMALPFFGGIIQQLAVARFCQAFGTLVRAGVPYLEGLEASLKVVQHPLVGRAVQFVYAGVRNGVTLEFSICSQHAFPAVMRSLIGAGEMSGSVDTALLKTAEYLRSDAEYKVRNAAKFAGPALTIAVGIIVLLILLAFWSSYWDKIMSVLEE